MAKFDVVQPGDFPALERVLWCGEVLPTPTLIYWMQRVPQATFTNLYGPTEATIASSYYTVPACPTSEDETIPIGQACGGEELLVLDAALRPVPAGGGGGPHLPRAGAHPGPLRGPPQTPPAVPPPPGGAPPGGPHHPTRGPA